jgi:hypothetical protein
MQSSLRSLLSCDILHMNVADVYDKNLTPVLLQTVTKGKPVGHT